MSDYHRGQTCEEAYPKEFREEQARKKQLAIDQSAARKKTLQLAKAIKEQFGVTFEKDGYGEDFHYIRLHFWKGAKAKL